MNILRDNPSQPPRRDYFTATSDDRSLDFNDGRNAPPSPPSPGRESYYCVAGCTTDRGDVDPRYTRGETARSEVLAISTALESLRRVYNCSKGIRIESCSRR